MTKIDPAIGEAPQQLLLAMEQLLSRERTVSEFRDEMLNELYQTPKMALAIRAMIEDYSKRGLIPAQIKKLLLRDIDKATDEEHPTTPTEFTLPRERTSPVDTSENDITGPLGVAADAEQVDEAIPVKQQARRSSDKEQPLRVGSMLRNRFEIVGRAAGGSMGVVYKAIDRRLAEAEGGQPYVAIKVLAPQFAGHGGAMRALQQEATKGRYLNHPNIVRFLDLDRDDEQIFLVMEWLDGRSLSELLNERRGQALDNELAWHIIYSIGQALKHAHKHGVTHADIKPGNVMLLPEGGVKLLDFGIARARGRLAGKTVAFDPSVLQAATPAYASPQVLGGQPARPIDDVYSLACLAYRLLSGRRVYGEKTSVDAVKDAMRVPRIEGLESRKWRALSSALSLSAETRTPEISRFLDDLGLSGKEGASQSSWKMRSAAGIGVLVVLLGAGAVFSPTLGTKIEQWRAVFDGSRVVAEPIASAAVADALSPQAEVLGDEAGDKQIIDAGQEVPPQLGQTPVTKPAVVSTQERSPPEIEFNLERADIVAGDEVFADDEVIEPAPALPLADLELLIDESTAGVVTNGELRLVEGAGRSRIRIRRSDSTQPARLRLYRQPAPEAVEATLAKNLRSHSADIIELVSGQSHAEIFLENTQDSLIEPDAFIDYTIVNMSSNQLLANMRVFLLDDDRQRIAASLRPDTVGFSQPTITVEEWKSSVEISLWRLNPRAGNLLVTLVLHEEEARLGEDFVLEVPIGVEFEEGQTTAVIYVPLIQDDEAEMPESFSLSIPSEGEIDGVHSLIRVRILDR